MRSVLICLFSLFLPLPLAAEQAADVWRGIDIALLGEVHDNPEHHQTQARLVTEIAPRALVFEMLTPDQAQAAGSDTRRDEAALALALQWEQTGWPEFSQYAPIFLAAPEAALFGAGLPRGAARQAMQEGIVASFGADAGYYGLDQPLPSPQIEARLALQLKAHCNALPEHLLPSMVALQRMRDALLARAALQAFEQTGGPVVVITGNGHARTDWGATALLRQLRPELRILALGQGEDGEPPRGSFDVLADAPAVDRPDPCAAFN